MLLDNYYFLLIFLTIFFWSLPFRYALLYSLCRQLKIKRNGGLFLTPFHNVKDIMILWVRQVSLNSCDAQSVARFFGVFLFHEPWNPRNWVSQILLVTQSKILLFRLLVIQKSHISEHSNIEVPLDLLCIDRKHFYYYYNQPIV